MKVLAIDPGYDRVGIAVLEGDKNKHTIVFSECLVTDRKKEIYERMNIIGNRVEEIIKKYKPKTLSLESLFFSKNTKTAMRVAEVRGIILFLASRNKLKIVEFTPNQIKLALAGHGQASKKDIEFALNRFFGIDTKGKIDDELDAIATGLACLAMNKD